jgi:hypothetical protein
VKTILAQLDTAITELEATGKYQDAKELHEVFLRVAALGDFNPMHYLSEGLKGGVSGGMASMMMSGNPAGGMVSGAIGAGYAAGQDIYYHLMNKAKKTHAKAGELKKTLESLMMSLEHIEPNLAMNVKQRADLIYNAVTQQAQTEAQQAQQQLETQPNQPTQQPITAPQSYYPNQPSEALQFGNLQTMPDSIQNTYGLPTIHAETQKEIRRLAAWDWKNMKQKAPQMLKNPGNLIPETFREKVKDNFSTIGKDLGAELVHLEPEKLMSNWGASYVVDKVMEKVFEKLYHTYVSVKTQAQMALKEIPKIIEHLTHLTANNPTVQGLLAELKQIIAQAHETIRSFNPKTIAEQKAKQQAATSNPNLDPLENLPQMGLNPNLQPMVHAESIGRMCRTAFLESLDEVIEEQEEFISERNANELQRVFIRMSDQGFFTARWM